MGEAWPAYPAALTEHVDDWAQGIYRDELGATYIVDTARRLIAATRDYGVRAAMRSAPARPARMPRHGAPMPSTNATSSIAARLH